MTTRSEQLKALRDKQRQKYTDNPIDTGGFGDDSVWASIAPKYRDPGRKLGAMPHRVRLLPSYKIFKLDEEPTEANSDFWLCLYYHGKALKNMERKLLCPNKSKVGHGTCPLCDIQEKAFASKAQADRSFAGKLKSRPKYFVNMYFPDDLDAGVKVWGIPPTAFDLILYGIHLMDEYPAVDDIEEGIDLNVTVKENQGGYWEYTVTPVHNSTPIIMPDWESKLINLEDLLLRNVPTHEQLVRIAMGDSSKDVFKRAQVSLSEDQVSSMTQSYAADILAAPVVPQSPGGAIAAALEDEEEDDVTPPPPPPSAPRKKRRKFSM